MNRNWAFQRYGVSLTKVEMSDIEMIRLWRNDPKISTLMIDKSYISEDAQVQWFKRMTKDKSQQYYLAYFKEQPIGVVSLIAIDQQKGTAEPSMYIYADQYRSNIVPFCVAFALNELAFEVFYLQCLLGKIYPDNEASLRFHEQSGYQQTGFDEKSGLLLLKLEKEIYDIKKKKITHFIRY